MKARRSFALALVLLGFAGSTGRSSAVGDLSITHEAPSKAIAYEDLVVTFTTSGECGPTPGVNTSGPPKAPGNYAVAGASADAYTACTPLAAKLNYWVGGSGAVAYGQRDVALSEVDAVGSRTGSITLPGTLMFPNMSLVYWITIHQDEQSLASVGAAFYSSNSKECSNRPDRTLPCDPSVGTPTSGSGTTTRSARREVSIPIRFS